MSDKKYKPEPLVAGNYYHIYNRGNNGIDIFYEPENYYHFLRLYDQYIQPIAETFAWCLMKNHFHVLVYIRKEDEVLQQLLAYSTIETPKAIDASRQFGHLFNAYTQAMNKRYSRTGSLFEKPFERKIVASEKYFKNLIYYIHNNPVYHGFTKNINDYPWSSYETVISEKATKLKRQEVLNLFLTKQDFIDFHHRQHDMSDIFHLTFD